MNAQLAAMRNALLVCLHAIETDGEPLPGTRWHRAWCLIRDALGMEVHP